MIGSLPFVPFNQILSKKDYWLEITKFFQNDFCFVFYHSSCYKSFWLLTEIHFLKESLIHLQKTFIFINTWVSQKFCNILVCASLQHIYYMSKAVWGVSNVVGSLVVDNTLTFCALCSTMLVTALYYGFGSETTICISRLFVYQFPLYPCCLWKIHRWGIERSTHRVWHTLSETSYNLGDSLEQIVWVFVTQRQEKLSVTINNYLLKHNSVTIIYTIYTIYIYIYIYIYIGRERERLSLLLCLRGRQLRYLADTIFLSYSIFRRVKLLLKRL